MQLQVDLTLLHCSPRQAIYGLGLAAAAAAAGGDFAAEVVFMSLAVLLVTQTDFVRPTTTGKRIERGGGGGSHGRPSALHSPSFFLCVVRNHYKT